MTIEARYPDYPSCVNCVLYYCDNKYLFFSFNTFATYNTPIDCWRVRIPEKPELVRILNSGCYVYYWHINSVGFIRVYEKCLHVIEHNSGFFEADYNPISDIFNEHTYRDIN